MGSYLHTSMLFVDRIALGVCALADSPAAMVAPDSDPCD
jgi:hypothetical protein